jgi:hypothetical protein
MKMDNLSAKKKVKLYTQLANQIKTFNKNASRKLRLFMGSRKSLKTANKIPTLQNNIMGTPSPTPTAIQSMMQSQYLQRPHITAHLSNPSPVTANSAPINTQPQQQSTGKRALFLDALSGGLGNIGSALGDTASSAAGAVKDTAGGVGSALGANGGAGIGLLGAGAGLMMATMGSEDERNERDNLEQELRSKEFKFIMEQGKKSTEMGTLDKHVGFWFYFW